MRCLFFIFFFFSSRRRHTRSLRDWSSDVCSSDLDPERLERFLREARTASLLNHPHICVVHALEKHEERPFIVMEFIEGETLQAQIERRPSLEKVARWIGQAAQALATAHAAGVVHRDIKPENMMEKGRSSCFSKAC